VMDGNSLQREGIPVRLEVWHSALLEINRIE